MVSIYDVESGRRVTSIDVNPIGPASIRWSPDDRFLLVPGDVRVGIIDVATGTYTLSEAEFRGFSGVWSPDGLEIVTLGASGQVTFWNATTLKVISQANDPTMLQCKAIDWSPDGRWIVMGGLGGRMTLWDASLRRKVRDIVRPEGGDFVSVAWEPIPADGVTADFDWPRLLVGDGQIWDSEVQEKRVGVSLNSPGYECRWSPDGRRVLFSVADGPRVFDARTGILAAECSLPSPVDFRSHYQISTDGKTLRTLQKDDLQIHNAETGEFLRRVSRMPFGKLEASPKDDWIAIYDPAGESGQLTLVDTATYEKRTLLTGHSGKISAARWSGDGDSLASAGHDGTVRIWKASDATQVHELQHGVPVTNVTWDGTGKLIASCSVDRVIRIWSAESGKLQQQYPALEFSPGEGRDGLAWSPSAEMVAIASYSGHALLLDLKSGKLSDPLFSFGGAMTDVVWSIDGRKLTGASSGGIGYRQLSAKSGLTATGHGSPVCWLADNRRLVTGQSASTPIQAVDTLKMTRLGLLFPRIGIDGWLCIGADGHYHGSEGIESHIVYVALHKDGSQSTHTPADFQQKFAWVNDPAKASLLKLRDRKSAVD